ncbi:MAG: NADP-dependent oxidoreductase [Pseudomonadales bacterium]|nr:NADP-dependent oxidoreductase [Pseudomonadales bacterium]MCP5184964.1 NADP-dependent oxidoreductase [Pseudomonadales bacterium]
MTTQRQWLINGQPRGRAVTEDDFLLHEAELAPLASGEARVRVQILSFDPSQKGQMENVGYAAATGIGQVMTARGIGEVVESRCESLKVGNKVIGQLGWQEFATVSPTSASVVPDDELLTARLGPLGGTGLTAYFGLLRNGHPEPGDMLVVSGAAGATGSVVGQIGKMMGCTVVGIAGGQDKCAWLTDDLGFDAAIDYRGESVKARLKQLCPQGVNVFFDNVGGTILNDVLARIALHARVVICGGISRYQADVLPPGPANYMNLVFMRATMSGFLMTDYAAESPQALERLTAWVREGRIRYREDMQEGFERIPATLLRLFSGENFGKQLLRL